MADRPLFINEERDGHVEPIDKDGNPAPVDLTKPFEYQTDLELVDLIATVNEPLKFRCKFKRADEPVTIAFVCHNLIGEQIRCSSTFIASTPPPPIIVAVGGRIVLD